MGGPQGGNVWKGCAGNRAGLPAVAIAFCLCITAAASVLLDEKSALLPKWSVRHPVINLLLEQIDYRQWPPYCAGYRTCLSPWPRNVLQRSWCAVQCEVSLFIAENTEMMLGLRKEELSF